MIVIVGWPSGSPLAVEFGVFVLGIGFSIAGESTGGMAGDGWIRYGLRTARSCPASMRTLPRPYLRYCASMATRPRMRCEPSGAGYNRIVPIGVREGVSRKSRCVAVASFLAMTMTMVEDEKEKFECKPIRGRCERRCMRRWAEGTVGVGGGGEVYVSGNRAAGQSCVGREDGRDRAWMVRRRTMAKEDIDGGSKEDAFSSTRRCGPRVVEWRGETGCPDWLCDRDMRIRTKYVNMRFATSSPKRCDNGR